MKIIESINNPYIKGLIKLHEKKYRDEVQKFLIEGYHLVEEAKKTNLLLQVLIINEEDYQEGVENIFVNEAIINKLSFTKSPQKIIGVCRYFDEYPLSGQRFVLLDDLQDPGNLGTIVRSSLGFNVDMVVLGLNSVDIYNDKFIRSTQGGIFNIKIIKRDLLEVINLLKQKGIKIIGTEITKGIELNILPKYQEFALVLGNEGNGISSKVLKATDVNVYIKTNERLESLNVAVAGGIILHHLNSEK